MKSKQIDLSGIGAPSVSRVGGSLSQTKKFQFADLSSGMEDDFEHDEDLLKSDNKNNTDSRDQKSPLQESEDMVQSAILLEESPIRNQSNHEDHPPMQDSINHEKLSQATDESCSLDSAHGKLEQPQLKAHEPSQHIQFQQFVEETEQNENDSPYRQTHQTRNSGFSRSGVSDFIYQKAQPLYGIDGVQDLDSLDGSSKLTSPQRTNWTNRSHDQKQLQLQMQKLEHLNQQQIKQRDQYENQSLISGSLEADMVAAENKMIKQPIQFYEVKDDAEEDQLIENKAWSQSFDDGHLFSIAEQTSGREETLGAPSGTNITMRGIGSLPPNFQENFAMPVNFDEDQKHRNTVNPKIIKFRDNTSLDSPTANDLNVVKSMDGKLKKQRTNKSFENKYPNEIQQLDRLESYLQQQDAHQGNRHPFDVASDEDLLASNFDRSSKALQLILLESDRTNKRQSNDPYVRQLLLEIQSLHLKLKQGEKSHVQKASVGVMVQPSMSEHVAQTYGPRKTSYYREIPAKVRTNLPNKNNKLNRSDSEINDQRLDTLGSSKRIQRSELSHKDHPLSQSPSNNRKASPTTKIISPAKSNELKALRANLLQARAQIKDQQSDNILLQDRIQTLENILNQKDKQYQSLQKQQIELNSTNCFLQAELEHHTKKLDCLKAEHFESTYPPELFQRQPKEFKDSTVQTDQLEWEIFIESRAIEERDQRQQQHSNRTPQTSRHNRSRLHTIPHIDNNFSREEQGYPNEMSQPRFIQELEQRALEYEAEYKRLEGEISDYKLQLQYAVQYQRYEQGHTLEQSTPQSIIVHQQPKATISHQSLSDETSLKNRNKKLEKRIQRITLRDMQNQNTIIQLDRIIKESGEKYRDMKQRMEFKVHEKETQINELRQNLQFYQLQMLRPAYAPQQQPFVQQSPDIYSLVNQLIDRRMSDQSASYQPQMFGTQTMSRKGGEADRTNKDSTQNSTEIQGLLRQMPKHGKKKSIGVELNNDQITFQQNSVYTDSIDGKPVMITNGLVHEFMQASQESVLTPPGISSISSNFQAEQNVQKMIELRKKYGVQI